LPPITNGVIIVAWETVKRNKMIKFNAILESEGVDTAQTKLVHHRTDSWRIHITIFAFAKNPNKGTSV